MDLLKTRKLLLESGQAMMTGKRGGKYYLSGGKKIYVDKQGKPTTRENAQAFKEDTGGFKGVAKQVYQKIKSMRSSDEITTAIFGIDKLLQTGRLNNTEVDALYQEAGKHMKAVENAVKKQKSGKREKRKDKIMGKRISQEGQRKKGEQTHKKKYKDKLERVKTRFESWKGKLEQLKKMEGELSTKDISDKTGLDKLRPMVDKLKKKKEKLQELSKIIKKGHPKHDEFISHIEKFNSQSKALKTSISSKKTDITENKTKQKKINAFKNKARRILTDYSSQTKEMKQRVLGKSLEQWIMSKNIV